MRHNFLSVKAQFMHEGKKPDWSKAWSSAEQASGVAQSRA
jgi:hypothetical protein